MTTPTLSLIPAGGANCKLNEGRRIRYVKGTPRADLFVAMLDRMGVDSGRFGDGQCKLDRNSIWGRNSPLSRSARQHSGVSGGWERREFLHATLI